MTKLFLGNLSYDVNENDLNQLFAGFPGVKINLIKDRESGRSKGFAFVELETAEQAEKAIAEFNEQELKGRAMKVAEAKPQENRPRGGGGGRGGFGGGGRGGGYGGGRGGGGGYGGGRGGDRDRGDRGGSRGGDDWE